MLGELLHSRRHECAADSATKLRRARAARRLRRHATEAARPCGRRRHATAKTWPKRSSRPGLLVPSSRAKAPTAYDGGIVAPGQTQCTVVHFRLAWLGSETTATSRGAPSETGQRLGERSACETFQRFWCVSTYATAELVVPRSMPTTNRLGASVIGRLAVDDVRSTLGLILGVVANAELELPTSIGSGAGTPKLKDAKLRDPRLELHRHIRLAPRRRPLPTSFPANRFLPIDLRRFPAASGRADLAGERQS